MDYTYNYELFTEAENLAKECALSMLYDDEKWDGKRQALYSSGPIHGMYRERNAILMNALEESVNIQRLKNLLIKSIDGTHDQIKRINKAVYETNNIAEDVRKKIDDNQKERHNSEIKSVKNAKDTRELLEVVNQYNSLFLQDLRNETVERKLRFLELYFEYREYKMSQAKAELFSDRNHELAELYGSVFDKKSSYKKYDLIPIDEVRTLKVMDPPRIYDSNLDKTIIITCPKRLAELLSDLYGQGLIGEMSFKGTSKIFDGVFDIQNIFEEMERGRIFSLNFNDFADVTKLYSDEYNDQLWIIKDGNDIYFEELTEDFDKYKDSIVTRMLHAAIVEDSYIQHMDFEYIFYSSEEFEKRKKEANTKGSCKKRRKLFKIDKCRIPFDFKIDMMRTDDGNVQVPIFYCILDLFFEHKNLLNEYFEKACL